MVQTIAEAEKQLKDIEASLKRAHTQLRNSCIEKSTRERLSDEVSEVMFEVHHLVTSPEVM